MQKIYFHTQGCTANAYESEAMAGMLAKVGYEIVDNIDSNAPKAQSAGSIRPDNSTPDMVVLNICTVKGNKTALDTMKALYKQFPDKKFVITGCIPREAIADIRKIIPNASLCSTTNMKSIIEAVEETFAGNLIEAMSYKREIKVNLPRIRKNKVVGITPILQGCAHLCTFCSTRLVKGRVLSFPADEIIADVKQNIADGCKEIWLTSQDNGAYMLDHQKITALPELLRQILALEGDFKVRLGMMNPTHILPVLDEIIEVFNHPKMFKFIHVPIQAGSNKILDAMKRQYTAEEFKSIIDKFRAAHQNITISTDVICGFPDETEEDFNGTVNLVKEIKFEIINLARFAPRALTVAAKMPGQIHGNVKKERTRVITKLYREIAAVKNQRWVNWQGEVMIDEISDYSPDGIKTWNARNYAYKIVIIKDPNNEFSLGDKLLIKIKRATAFDLRAEVVGVVEKYFDKISAANKMDAASINTSISEKVARDKLENELLILN
ncbi:tRNA (N(6)-L-threonylcarbamoyladenosine(37)-C(2))-methylthiotransferase [Candidatus Woesearchaeota archaeon]|nr:tRNA (N(6)-L-threonylcarbamoyladenosine(37)-C(2))-methylthiotransferase [Candidatus Woesearchaeota archaeon]